MTPLSCDNENMARIGKPLMTKLFLLRIVFSDWTSWLYVKGSPLLLIKKLDCTEIAGGSDIEQVVQNYYYQF